MVFNVHRDGEKGGRGYGGGGTGRDIYTSRYAAVTTIVIPALRGAAMRAILTFQ